MQPLIAPIIQTMVVVHNIAGIEKYEENDELREIRRAAEKNLLQGFQETNNRGAKAFRDRARELIMPCFIKGDDTMEEDEKYVHAMLSTFGFTGSTVLHHRHPAGYPVLRECMATPRPTERGELTATLPSRQRPRHSCVPVTVASPARHPALPRVRDKRALRPRPSPCQGIHDGDFHLVCHL